MQIFIILTKNSTYFKIPPIAGYKDRNKCTILTQNKKPLPNGRDYTIIAGYPFFLSSSASRFALSGSVNAPT
jgi:hypothetical protein